MTMILIQAEALLAISNNIDKLNELDSLLSTPSQENARLTLQLLNEGYITGLTKWVFISPQYTHLIGDYNPMIKNENLRFRVQMHYRDNESRIQVKDDINDYVKEYKDLEDMLNPDEGAIRENSAVIFSNQFRNKIKRLLSEYEALENFTNNTRAIEEMLIEQIDIELENW